MILNFSLIYATFATKIKNSYTVRIVVKKLLQKLYAHYFLRARIKFSFCAHDCFNPALYFCAAALALPLFPAAIRRFDLAGYDLVLSFSHCVAKGVRTPPGAAHLCYCFTPMRYAWGFFEDYFGSYPSPVITSISIAMRAQYSRMHCKIRRV